MHRFNAKVLEIPSATPDLLIRTFIQGFKPGDLFNSLVKKPHTSFGDLLDKSEKFINMEEAPLTRVTGAKKDERPHREIRVEHLPTQVPRANPAQLLGKFATYTPLKINKARALEICEQRNLIQRPPGSAKGPRDAPSDKYYEFHNDYGHTLDECMHLAEEIENKIRV